MAVDLLDEALCAAEKGPLVSTHDIKTHREIVVAEFACVDIEPLHETSIRFYSFYGKMSRSAHVYLDLTPFRPPCRSLVLYWPLHIDAQCMRNSKHPLGLPQELPANENDIRPRNSAVLVFDFHCI
jgi:hypothetical protein